jgi:hypothetical protein
MKFVILGVAVRGGEAENEITDSLLHLFVKWLLRSDRWG